MTDDGEYTRIIDDVEYVVARNDLGRPGWGIYVGNEGDTTGHTYDTRGDAISALQRKANRARDGRDESSTPAERLAVVAAQFETAAAAIDDGAILDHAFLDDLYESLGLAPVSSEPIRGTTHERDDCEVCREHDAVMLVTPAHPYWPEGNATRPRRWCASCAGDGLALLVRLGAVVTVAAVDAHPS